MNALQITKKLLERSGLLFLNFIYAPVLLAGKTDWFPKAASKDDMSTGANSAMDVAGRYVIQGLSILLLVVSVGTLIKFVTTIQHGIEESKRSESGSLAAFGGFAFMGAVNLACSLAAGYLAYVILTKFTL